MVIIERRPPVVTSPLRRKKHMFQIGGRYRCAKHPTNLRSVPGRPGNGTRPPSEPKRRGNARPRRYPTPSPLRSTGPPIRRPIGLGIHGLQYRLRRRSFSPAFVGPLNRKESPAFPILALSSRHIRGPRHALAKRKTGWASCRLTPYTGGTEVIAKLPRVSAAPFARGPYPL